MEVMGEMALMAERVEMDTFSQIQG